MHMRNLGRSDLSVAPLAFGCNVFGWTADEPTSFALLDAFVDAGFNLLDTADTYSRWAHNGTGGQSETIIGKWFTKSGKRDRVVLATKVGGDMGESRKGLAKKYILNEVEESLRRLQTDCIDLYQAHFDDETTPQDETLDAFNLLVTQGKVRVIGASNFSADRLRSALATSREWGFARYETLQPEYNLVERDEFERDLEEVCETEGLGVIPYFSPSGRGSYKRPQLRLIYAITSRNSGARALYAADDVFSQRAVEHFIAIGAEWWFNSTSYP